MSQVLSRLWDCFCNTKSVKISFRLTPRHKNPSDVTRYYLVGNGIPLGYYCIPRLLWWRKDWEREIVPIVTILPKTNTGRNTKKTTSWKLFYAENVFQIGRFPDLADWPVTCALESSLSLQRRPAFHRLEAVAERPNGCPPMSRCWTLTSTWPEVGPRPFPFHCCRTSAGKVGRLQVCGDCTEASCEHLTRCHLHYELVQLSCKFQPKNFTILHIWLQCSNQTYRQFMFSLYTDDKINYKRAQGFMHFK